MEIKYLMSRQIYNKTVNVDGVDIFYREAGDRKNKSLLLLHGFPTSSVMFKNLMTVLSDEYHLVAPDYPGFGFSAFPDKNLFKYTFKNIAVCMNRFTEEIGLKSFTIYLHDYGAQIGLPLCVSHPEKIEGLIVQSGNAYEEGLGETWKDIRDYWKHPTEDKRKKVYGFLSAAGTKDQYTAGLPAEMLDRVSPETWILDWERMSRPGNLDMQFELNCDYPNHFAMFPVYHKYFREHQPRALVIWGKYEVYFDVAEAQCYKRDLPKAQVHILDCGHMALETNFDEVRGLISKFMASE